nr:MAG TPA: hypothetical protein [Caudoviricetes sp.]
MSTLYFTCCEKNICYKKKISTFYQTDNRNRYPRLHRLACQLQSEHKADNVAASFFHKTAYSSCHTSGSKAVFLNRLLILSYLYIIVKLYFKR